VVLEGRTGNVLLNATHAWHHDMSQFVTPRWSEDGAWLLFQGAANVTVFDARNGFAVAWEIPGTHVRSALFYRGHVLTETFDEATDTMVLALRDAKSGVSTWCGAKSSNSVEWIVSFLCTESPFLITLNSVATSPTNTSAELVSLKLPVEQ
jgi:hypothetical protein